jgi:hypothetical protein
VRFGSLIVLAGIFLFFSACDSKVSQGERPRSAYTETINPTAFASSTAGWMTVDAPVSSQPVTSVVPHLDSPFGVTEGVGAIPQLVWRKYDAARFPGDVARDASLLAQTGAGWYRIHSSPYGGFSQDRMERDQYSFALQDELVRGLQAQGLAIVAVLGPRPGNDRPCQEAYLPNGEASFADYLRRVVERYDGDGAEDMPGLLYPVHHWQIDNEVDLHWYNCKSLINSFSAPQDYVNALRIAQSAIRAADSRAVIFPSFWYAGNQFSPDGAWYFEEFIRLGGLNYVDAIDVHDYGFRLDRFLARLQALHALTQATPKPIWIMETSVPSDPVANAAWDEARHAWSVAQWYAAGLAQPDVKRIFWFTLYQYPPRPDDRSWQSFGSNGLYDCQDPLQDAALGINQCSRTPLSAGGRTYQIMARMLTGYQSAERITDAIYRFRFADSHSIWVAWSASGTVRLDLTGYGWGGTVRVIHVVDRLGQVEPVVEEMSATDVRLDERPILIEQPG